MTDVFEENNYDLMESYAKYYQREFKIVPEYQKVIISGQNQEDTELNFEIDLSTNQEIMFRISMLGKV